ncbi:hypothetical protein ACFFX1_44365 [Dactylosporangium sucinum]|uniref:hypothetical protein n=1 Tax=Dactylosporangium sucinum TaxID=1424081 RepID=UPI00167CD047|nr:hypothetical protein [Dactylosporangium sucinum]
MAVACAVSGFAVATASPATASVGGSIPAVASAYIDAATPAAAHVNEPGGLPVGLWRDDAGHFHLSRAFYTFDLSAYAGATVSRAALTVEDLSVADCSKPSSVAAFRAAAFTAPTWLQPPAQEALLDSTPEYVQPACPGYESWDITAEIAAALAAGRSSLTVELRLTGLRELDRRYARRYSSAGAIHLTYNKAPAVPSEFRVDGDLCGQDPLPVTTATPSISVAPHDPEGDLTAATFAVWPESDPLRRAEFPATANGIGYSIASVPPGTLVDDGVYLLSARSVDGDGAASAWAGPCRLYFDDHPPAAAPTVSSDVYPPGLSGMGSGLPRVLGRFTFSANGDTDVVGFRWGIGAAGTYQAADRPGGTATIEWTPQLTGDYHLVVLGVDRAGNTSPQADYAFRVASDQPVVEDHDPDAAFGQPRTITFHPVASGVVEYVYTFKDNTVHIVPAEADGTATVVLVPNMAGGGELTVYSRSADGYRSTTSYSTILPRSWPTITSEQYPTGGVVGAPAGTPGVFVVTSYLPNVVSYSYRFDNGKKTTAATDADGNLVIEFTPTTPGPHTLAIGFGFLADGTMIDGTAYTFVVG